MSKKKKIIVFVCMICLLVLTGVMNVVLNKNIDATAVSGTGEVTTASFFATSRIDKTTTRNESIAQYKEILASSSSSQEAKSNAEAQINALVEAMSMETTMEGLIKAKGFSDALVNYSSTYINVIIKSAGLTEDEVTKIVDIIQSQAKRDIDYIKIIPVE